MVELGPLAAPFMLSGKRSSSSLVSLISWVLRLCCSSCFRSYHEDTKQNLTYSPKISIEMNIYVGDTLHFLALSRFKSILFTTLGFSSAGLFFEFTQVLEGAFKL